VAEWSALLRELRILIPSWMFVAGVGAIIALLLNAIFVRARPILPPQRRRASVWNGPLVLVAFLAFYFLPAFLLPYAQSTAFAQWIVGRPVDQPTANIIASCVVQILALPLQVGVWRMLLAFGGGARVGLDLNPRHMSSDFLAAFVTWLVVTPIAYLVSFAATLTYALIVGQKPEEHPIVQSMQMAEIPVTVTVLLITQALLIAPVKEELFFRGIVQPWLAERPWGGEMGIYLAAVVGVMIHLPRQFRLNDLLSLTSAVSALSPALFVLAVWPLYRWLDRCDLRWLVPIRNADARRQTIRAVFGTSLLFANFHSNVWPTPIPLFVLSLGLGWLAVRTQNVTASIIMHMMFNAIVFTNLYLHP